MRSQLVSDSTSVSGLVTYSYSRDAPRTSRPLRQSVGNCFKHNTRRFQRTRIVANVATLVARTTRQHHLHKVLPDRQSESPSARLPSLGGLPLHSRSAEKSSDVLRRTAVGACRQYFCCSRKNPSVERGMSSPLRHPYRSPKFPQCGMEGKTDDPWGKTQRRAELSRFSLTLPMTLRETEIVSGLFSVGTLSALRTLGKREKEGDPTARSSTH